jgi:septal ring factor EnvC (AmiA/AmiB activator)
MAWIKSVPISSASAQASRWPRALAILCLLTSLFAFTPRTLDAQPSSSPSPIPTTPTLSQLKNMTALLVTRLQSRIAESETLSAELVTLKDRAEKLQTDLSATSTSLEQSTQDLARLLADFNAYKDKSAADLARVEKERDAALTVARLGGVYLKIGAVVTAALAGYIGGHAAGWWK